MRKVTNFVFPMCPPLNSLYRHGRSGVYKIAKARQWENEVLWTIGKSKLIKGKVKVEMVMYLKRDRDIDSSLKLVLDVLEKAEVYQNDNQVVDLRVIKATDKGKPRIEVSVEAVIKKYQMEGK